MYLLDRISWFDFFITRFLPYYAGTDEYVSTRSMYSIYTFLVLPYLTGCNFVLAV